LDTISPGRAAKHGEHLGGLAAKIDRFAFDGSEFFAFRQEDKNRGT